MNNREIYEQFLTFVENVASETPDKLINHDDGWGTCVVGEFSEQHGHNAWNMSVVIREQNPDLHDVLNHYGVIREILLDGTGRYNNIANNMLDDNVDALDTYGQLYTFLLGEE